MHYRRRRRRRRSASQAPSGAWTSVGAVESEPLLRLEEAQQRLISFAPHPLQSCNELAPLLVDTHALVRWLVGIWPWTVTGGSVCAHLGPHGEAVPYRRWWQGRRMVDHGGTALPLYCRRVWPG